MQNKYRNCYTGLDQVLKEQLFNLKAQLLMKLYSSYQLVDITYENRGG